MAAKHKNMESSMVNIETNCILSAMSALQHHHKTSIAAGIQQNVEELYERIAELGSTIAPVSVKSCSKSSKLNSTQASILPSLTDDMFVVEAPSFIVPYVYEKPSLKPFREFVDCLEKELKEKLKDQKPEDQQNGKEVPFKQGKNEDDECMDVDGENESGSDKVDEDADKVPAVAPKSEVSEKKKRRQKTEEHDESWDGTSEDSEDEVISDDDDVQVIKDNDSIESVDLKDSITDLTVDKKPGSKSESYFDCSLGQFYIDIGMGLVQEFVQKDLLKHQQRKLYKEKKSGANSRATAIAISGLKNNLDYVKNKNAAFTHKLVRCQYCNFKSESMIILSHHLETPHMKDNVYKCNFCKYEIRSPHDILYHMEILHNVRGKLEKAPAYHQCSNCPYEDNGKGKLARHLVGCAKRFKPDLNLGPPEDWEPPAKIPKIVKPKNNVGSYPPMNKCQIPIGNSVRAQGMNNAIAMQHLMSTYKPRGRPPGSLNQTHGTPVMQGGLMMRYNTPGAFQNNSQIRLNPFNKNVMKSSKGSIHQPSISITPLPRQPVPAQQPGMPQSKGNFVICEICDGYIKDLEQLRNHMQWIHKVKIHPKMIYNRPPLNCQKCQCRFFTDQGLERHLLGSHGLVTSSMQEAANNGKDAGRCPVCGRVYQRKLLKHVASEHSLTLKPAHLSYKCTVCTATFGLYKKFENHVYSAHSVVAKRVVTKKTKPAPLANNSHDSLLKPLKISDEITIIPQPVKPKD